MNDKHQPHIAFGVYRLTDTGILDLAVRQAIDAGVDLIDTAPMYKNEEQIAKILAEPGCNAKAGTKLRKASTITADLERAIRIFGTSLERVLLHKQLPLSAYQVLEDARERGAVKQIGVCNYSAKALEELLVSARQVSVIAPVFISSIIPPRSIRPQSLLPYLRGSKETLSLARPNDPTRCFCYSIVHSHSRPLSSPPLPARASAS